MTGSISSRALSRRGAAALLYALVAATPAAAADVRISYTVEDKALKQAVSGTVLTFELFDEPTCTAPPVFTATPLIDDLFVERVKRFKPSGGAKPPNTARMSYQLVGAPALGTAFLRVTGNGVVAVAGDCQLQYTSAGTSLPCARQEGDEVIFEACNVNVRSGSGETNGTPNGLGNLVVGYNEARSCTLTENHCQTNAECAPADCFSGICIFGGTPSTCTVDADCEPNVCSTPLSHDGSHNIIVGDLHAYDDTYASIIGGSRNAIDNTGYAAILGGAHNTIDGALWSSIVGGRDNLVTNTNYGVIAGGLENKVNALFSSVLGGRCNLAGLGPRPSCSSLFAPTTTVAGGFQNQASGQESSVSGGASNLASGQYASVTGGTQNEARSLGSSVVGGQCNVAGAGPGLSGCTGSGGSDSSTVTAGFQNLASGNSSSVTGGANNTASGTLAVVSSGNVATQANPLGWSAGAFGSLITGRFSSP